MFLANSCSREAFREICVSDKLLSQTQVALNRKEEERAETAESVLGTADYVFFYLGPFRYPGTDCGLLFKRSLEDHRHDDGCASPFDSGGLVRYMQRPNPSETLRSFHSRHELPIPSHRELLALTLDLCFDTPSNYLTATDANLLRASPFGLTGGDLRRYTHEVRIPQSIPLRTKHLEAAFVAGPLGDTTAVEDFAEWCLQSGVHYQRFSRPGEGDFNALRREAIGYIMRKL